MIITKFAGDTVISTPVCRVRVWPSADEAAFYYGVDAEGMDTSACLTSWWRSHALLPLSVTLSPPRASDVTICTAEGFGSVEGVTGTERTNSYQMDAVPKMKM